MTANFPNVLFLLPVFIASSALGINLTNITETELRAAVNAGGNIVLHGTNVVELTNTLVFDKDTVLDGTAGNVTLRCAGNRALDIVSGVIQIRGITIADSGGFLTDGGALRNQGTAIVERCTFAGNSATNGTGSGGAIYNVGTLFVAESTFATNTGVIAAAIMNAGRATISRSTFTQNRGYATVSVGDIFRPATSTAITNCTLAYNQGDALGIPAQMFPTGPYGPAWISHCTIAANSGYGFSLPSGPGIPSASSSTFIINSAFSSNSLGSATSALGDLGGNATSDASLWFTNGTSLKGLDLKLGALTTNGGATLTMAPESGSPLIDRIPLHVSAAVDQRGVSRPVGPLSDGGAVEKGAVPGNVSFAAAFHTVSESEPTVNVLVTLLQAVSGVGTIEFFTTPQTASAGDDFVATNGVLTFAEGETSKFITVALVNDTLTDPAETFAVGLRNPTGSVTLGPVIETTIRIIDDDAFTVSDCTPAGLAAALEGASSIRFACDATIVLTNTIVVADFLKLDGNGRDVTIRGGGAVRLFEVEADARLVLDRVTLANGLGTQPGNGGAIRNRGQVVATDCRFIDNTAIGETGTPGEYMVKAAGAGGNAEGGAIWNSGAELFLTNVLFAGNRIVGGTGGPYGTLFVPAYGGNGGMASGGAIHASMSRVVAMGCIFVTNRAVPGSPGQGVGRTANSGLARGGAISAFDSEVILGHVSMEGHIAGGTGYVNHAMGGAVFQEGGVFTAQTCSFDSNSVMGGSGVVNGAAVAPGGHGFGGAILLTNSQSHFTNCAFVYNQAAAGAGIMGPFGPGMPGSGRGGAVVSAGNLTMVNSTVANNAAIGGAVMNQFYPYSGDGVGGGLFIAAGTAVGIHCTIASNIVAESVTPTDMYGIATGSAIYVATGAVATIQNTIVAAAAGTTNCFGGITDLGGNLSSDGSANFTHATSMNSLNPGLSPLLDFGGPTLTMALLEGSPAIDAAYMTATQQATDQRGRARPTSSGADIGAFESTPPWSLHGQVAGNKPTTGLVVQVGGTDVALDASGRFSRTDLAGGNVTVAVPQVDWVTLPASTNVNITRDVVGVDFEAYRRGTTATRVLPGNSIKITYAPPLSAETYVDYSTNLSHWTPMVTNQSGLTQWTELMNAPQRYFRFRPQMLLAPSP